MRWAFFLLLAAGLGYFLGYRKGNDLEVFQEKGSNKSDAPDNVEYKGSPRDTLTPEVISKVGLQPPSVGGEKKLDQDVVISPPGSTEQTAPMEEIRALVEAKKYVEAMEKILVTDFAQFQEEGLEMRALVATLVAEDWMNQGQRSEAKDLIIRERNLQPTNLSLVHVEVEWYRQVGRRPEAIQVLNHVLQSGIEEKERKIILSWRHDLMKGHLNALGDSEQWKELADFLKNDPAPGDERYYRYQLWAARAYTELFEFSKAKSALEMASFDHELLGMVETARSRIERLQSLRRQSVSSEAEVLTESLPIQKDTGDAKEWSEIPAVWINGSIIVTLEVGGRRLPLILDTGASITSVDAGLSSVLKDEVVKELGTKDFYTANGVTKGEVAQLGEVQLGNFVVRSVDVAFMRNLGMDSRYVGLLGMNVLRYFDFQLDEVASVVRLREKP